MTPLKTLPRSLSSFAMLTFIMVLVFGVQASPAAEFEARITIHQDGTAMNGYVFVSGDKSRVDMSGPQGKVITITRQDKGLTWIVNVPMKEYVEIQGLAINPLGMRTDQEWEKVAKKKVLGQEKYEGFACERTLYTFFDEKKGAVMEWKALDLDYTIKSILYSPKELVITELKDLKVEPVEAVAFEIPEDYKKVSVKKIPGKATKNAKE